MRAEIPDRLKSTLGIPSSIMVQTDEPLTTRGGTIGKTLTFSNIPVGISPNRYQFGQVDGISFSRGREILDELLDMADADVDAGYYTVSQTDEVWMGKGAEQWLNLMSKTYEAQGEEHHREIGAWVGPGIHGTEATVVTIQRITKWNSYEEFRIGFLAEGIPLSKNYRSQIDDLSVDMGNMHGWEPLIGSTQTVSEAIDRDMIVKKIAGVDRHDYVTEMVIENPWYGKPEKLSNLLDMPVKRNKQGPVGLITDYEHLYAHVFADLNGDNPDRLWVRNLSVVGLAEPADYEAVNCRLILNS